MAGANRGRNEGTGPVMDVRSGGGALLRHEPEQKVRVEMWQCRRCRLRCFMERLSCFECGLRRDGNERVVAEWWKGNMLPRGLGAGNEQGKGGYAGIGGGSAAKGGGERRHQVHHAAVEAQVGAGGGVEAQDGANGNAKILGKHNEGGERKADGGNGGAGTSAMHAEGKGPTGRVPIRFEEATKGRREPTAGDGKGKNMRKGGKRRKRRGEKGRCSGGSGCWTSEA